MQTRIRELQRNESGSAMITALLFVVIMTFLIASISITAISGLQKQQETADITGMQITSDSAISNAVAFANNPGTGRDLENHVGYDKAVYGISTATTGENDDGKFKWLWYLERVKDAVIGEGYDVIAISYKGEPTDPNAKTVRVRLQSTPVLNATYLSDGKIAYGPIPVGAFTWGVLGTNGATIAEGGTVRSYNSAQISNPAVANDTLGGTVSSNKVINIGGTDANSVRRAVLLQADSANIPVDRCLTAANCTGKMVAYSYGIDLQTIGNEVIAKCPLGASAYPDYRASTSNGIINPDAYPQGSCFNNVYFDRDTEVGGNYATGKPVNMYIAGDLVVSPGVEVNQALRSGGPLALRIYSAAGTNAKFNSGTATDPTMFSGMVAGYRFSCSDTPSDTASLTIKGSVACDTVNFGKGTTIWWDQQTVQVLGAGSDRNISTIWTPVSYEAKYE